MTDGKTILYSIMYIKMTERKILMKMLIGLTGRTGSGKSTAARIFENLGAFVADCDVIAHEVLCDSAVKEKLCGIFSRDILDKDNNIDRKALGAIVFSDKKKLSQLNSVVHGSIVERCLHLCRESGKDVCFLDGSELESSGVDTKCSYIVVIAADEEKRLGRIIQRDNIDRESALKRMNSQKDYSKSAIIINNNGSEAELREKITALYNKFSGEINA